ncbi:MAG: hypothetical protein ACYTDX_06375, partial [Planctomycetota bacterium]
MTQRTKLILLAVLPAIGAAVLAFAVGSLARTPEAEVTVLRIGVVVGAVVAAGTAVAVASQLARARKLERSKLVSDMERTRHDLTRAKEEAEQAGLAKGQFLAN